MNVLKSEVKEWIKQGQLWRTIEETDDEYVTLPMFIESDDVKNLEDFKKLLEFSRIMLLDEYPMTLYLYAHFNNKEVQEYLMSLLRNKHYDYITSEELRRNKWNYPMKTIEYIENSDFPENIKKDYIEYANYFIEEHDKWVKRHFEPKYELLIYNSLEKLPEYFEKNRANFNERFQEIKKSCNETYDGWFKKYKEWSKTCFKNNKWVPDLFDNKDKQNMAKSLIKDTYKNCFRKLEKIALNYNQVEYVDFYYDVLNSETLIKNIDKFNSFCETRRDHECTKKFLKEYKETLKYEFHLTYINHTNKKIHTEIITEEKKKYERNIKIFDDIHNVWVVYDMWNTIIYENNLKIGIIQLNSYNAEFLAHFKTMEFLTFELSRRFKERKYGSFYVNGINFKINFYNIYKILGIFGIIAETERYQISSIDEID